MKRYFLLLLALFSFLACGSGDDSSGPSDDKLEVSPDSLTATTLGATLDLTVTLGGQSVNASLSLRREQRWLDDRGVVDAAELQNSHVVARAPGRAVISVSFSGQTDSIIVNVVPTGPLVMEAGLPGKPHIGDGDTIVLRGYRLNAITAANVAITGGGTASIHSQDSANLRLLIPTIPASAGCTGAAPPLTISFTGTLGQSITGLTRKRTGEVSLSAGQALRLTDAAAACLLLSPAQGARYLLAWADSRLIDKAQTQPEFPWPDSIRATVADRTNSAPAVPTTSSFAKLAVANEAAAARVPATITADAVPRLVTEHDAPMQTSVPTGCPFNNFFLAFCQAAPWTLGENFQYHPAGTQRPADRARVIALRGNLVAAVFAADSPQLAPGAIGWADAALEQMRQRGVPLLQHIFSLSSPTRTSDESAQLLIAIEQSSSSFAQWWPDPSTGHGRWGKVTLQLNANSAFGDPTSNATRSLLIAAHEILHTYQFRYRFEHASPWIGALGTLWAVEGAATFFSLEMVREQLGEGFLSNALIGAFSSSDPRLTLQLYTYPVTDLTNGYLDAASFLRDLVQRLVTDGGITFDDALREVLAGALEGWFGINEEGRTVGPGLTARMRQRLGAGWNPVDALLDWTMSQCADELTGNPRYQNRTVRVANPGPSSNMIRRAAVITNGAAFSTVRAAGNTGVFEVTDNVGGSYSATATVNGQVSAALEWLLLRIS